MLSPDIELLRVTVSDMNLARQAIADINLSSSHHRLAVDDAALHEFLSDTRHYLIVAICDGRSWAAFTVMRCAILIDASHSSSSTESMFACSTRTVEWEPALVDRFISEARREKAFEVWVLTNHTNAPAVAMYERAGLKRCGDAEAMLELAL
jgi:ribosomal protein S18 acetylase RimI-like enzyme